MQKHFPGITTMHIQKKNYVFVTSIHPGLGSTVNMVQTRRILEHLRT